jgi:hypothetical protein
MSPRAVSEPACRTDGDAPARLAAIDHRLNQISTRLAATIGQLRSQLAEIHANLETLIGSLGSAAPIKAGPECGLPHSELPPGLLLPATGRFHPVVSLERRRRYRRCWRGWWN